MRLEYIHSESLMFKKLQCKKIPFKIAYPALLLSKASTDSTYRGSGLNLILRYYAFILVEKIGCHDILGTMVANSPRVKSITEMSYKFFEQKKQWGELFDSDEPVLVAHLNLKKSKKYG